MTFAAVGTIVQTATASLAISPTVIGNFFLVEVQTSSQTIWCTSISGGNCTWVQLGTVWTFNGAGGFGSATVFAGTATTTGSATATLAFNGTPPTIRCAGQQFSSTVGAWALDGSQGNLGSAGQANMPSLTPSAAGDLYFCYANDSGSATAGSTSGYTYQVDAHGNGLCYNAACINAAQAPVWGDAGEFFGVAILLQETVTSLPTSYQLQPPGRISPASLLLPDVFYSGIQPVNGFSSYALAPPIFGGNASVIQPGANPSLTPPGRISPASLVVQDWTPSSIQPVNVAGSYALAPLGFSGLITPPSTLQQSIQVSPPGRMSPASLAVGDWQPTTAAPVTVAGIFALAPLAYSGAANVLYPIPNASQIIPPGLQSPAAFGMTAQDSMPSQAAPVNVAGSFAISPIVFSGAASLPAVQQESLYGAIPPGLQSPSAFGIAAQNTAPSQPAPATVAGLFALASLGLSGVASPSGSPQANAYTEIPPGRISPASLGIGDWIPASIQPVNVAGSYTLSPLGFSGAGTQMPPSVPGNASLIVPPGLRSPASISERVKTIGTARPAPVGFSGRMKLGPFGFSGRILTPEITVVQTAHNSAQSNTVTATFANNIAVGNSVIVVMLGIGASLITPSGGTDSWTVITDISLQDCSMAYVSSSVGGYKSVSATYAAGNTFAAIYMYEVTPSVVYDSPNAKGQDLDTSSGNYDSGTTGTTSQPQEIWVGGAFCSNSTSASSISGPGAPWVDQAAINNVSDTLFGRWDSVVSSYQLVTVVGTAQYTGVPSQTNLVNWGAGVAAFRLVANPIQVFDTGHSSEQIQVGIVQNESLTPSETGTSSEAILIGQYSQFPQNILPIKTELLLNGTWVDVSRRVYYRSTIYIARGRPNESSTATPASMTLTLDNRDGAFSSRNPASPYYPFITRNTQIRISLAASSSSGTFYPPGGTVGYRFWGEVSEWPPSWDPTGSDVYISITASGALRRLQNNAKIGTALKRYYSTLPTSKQPIGQWDCEDSSGSQFFASALPGVPNGTWSGTPSLASGNIAGGSDPVAEFNGSVWTFQTGAAGNPTASGVQVYTAPGVYFWQAPAGVTAVTGVLCMGSGGGGAGSSAGSRQGTDGGKGGDSLFTGDSLVVIAHGGRGGQRGVQSRGSGMPGAGGTGSTNTVHFDGGSGTYSIGVGSGGGSSAGIAAPGNSSTGTNGAVAPTGGGNGGDGGPIAFFGSDGQSPSAGPGGGGGAAISFDATTRTDDFGGSGGGGESAQEPTVSVTPLQIYRIVVGAAGTNGGGDFVGGAGFSGLVTFSWSAGVASPITGNYLRFLMGIPSGGGVDGTHLVTMSTLGTIATVTLFYHTGGYLQLVGYNSAGIVLFDSGLQNFNVDGVPLLMSIELVPFGSGISWTVNSMQPGSTTPYASAGGTLAGITLGVVTSVQSNAAGIDTGQTAMGHMVVQYAADTLDVVSVVAGGHIGELAANRFTRLCNEQGIVASITGYPTDTPAMGPQVNDTLINLLQGIEDLDRGQIFEPRNFFGLSYRTRKSLQNQYPQLYLDYSLQQLSPPFQPIEDDQLIRNSVQVTRAGGSTATVLLSTGPTPWIVTAQGTPLNNTYFIVTTSDAAKIAVGDTFTDQLNPGQIFMVTVIGAPFVGFVNISFSPNSVNVMSGPDAMTQNNLVSLSTQDPPLGVGLYPFQVTVAAENDMQLVNLAQWILEIGTVTDYRYPQITVELTRAANSVHFSDLPAIDVGDYFQVINPPASFLTPFTIKQLAWGFTESLNVYTWTIQINAVPENPYDGPSAIGW